MTDTPKLRGMANVSYWASDWEAAKTWYTELIGFEPYFQRDGYAEWRLGDYQDLAASSCTGMSTTSRASSIDCSPWAPPNTSGRRIAARDS
jgi:catechol 2,3-dioxygenase-like lactoylglutathione lyase family enzyme